MIDNNKVKDAVAALFNTGNKVYVACTGAGAGIAKMLWQVPGASGTLVGAPFTYAQGDSDIFLGTEWSKSGYSYCGPEAAIALAQASYLRAQQIGVSAGNISPIIAVGLTAAVTTNRELKGGTRCYAAVRTKASIHTCEVWMKQGFLGREGDGEVCDLIALNLVLFAAGLPQIPFEENLYIEFKDFSKSDYLILAPTKFVPPVLPDEFDAALFGINGKLQNIPSDFSDNIIFPGSFNPLHFGHDAMAKIGELVSGKKAIFEITAKNADKTALSKEDLALRLNYFVGRWPVIVHKRGATLFIDKVRAYAGATRFIVGFDTAARILDPKYYESYSGKLEGMLLDLAQSNVKLHVVSRTDNDKVLSCRDLNIPFGFEGLFAPLPGRWDISSTALRKEVKV